ncbi:MAG: ATP-binding protein [Burkholderiaceae bacterium]|jgi:two-component system sensor histidine kinase QseC|nr:ATP-binding protein [Burkholderiaceae bacterium]
MTLRRRLLVLLLVAAPLLWLLTLLLTVLLVRKEINELFDTQQVRLARQVLTLLPAEPMALAGTALAPLPPTAKGRGSGHGDAEIAEMAIAVASADGRLLLTDREGPGLPLTEPAGFTDIAVGADDWRVYTLLSEGGDWRVVVGQMSEERDEVLQDLLMSQALPGLIALPLLLLAMTWAVRRALAPLATLRAELSSRQPGELRPLDAAQAPGELQPLLEATNALMARVDQALAQERRLTADAAHELRTPLAALRAQWEAAQAATDPQVRAQAQRQVGEGMDRLSHLVSQLLTLARAESEPLITDAPVDWPRAVQDALSDCLPLMDERASEVEVVWPAHGIAPLPLSGSTLLMGTLLRNLVDNALRYAPRASIVHLRFGPDALVIEDRGPGLTAEAQARLGDRFYRPPGQAQTGSGLGVSIVRRIAQSHGLRLDVAARDDGPGLRVMLRRAGR